MATTMNSDGSKKGSSVPRSPVRTMQVIEALAESAEGLSLADLVKKLRLPKTTLLSLLKSLLAADYLVWDGYRYRIGPSITRLTYVVAATADLRVQVRAIIGRLVDATNETVLLATLTEGRDEVIYIDAVEPDSAIRFSVKIGSRRPLYCSAAGRALLAFQDPSFVASYLRHQPLTAVTQYTITDVGVLRKQLALVRKTGLAVTEGETLDGVAAFSAPVFNNRGKVAYAISMPVAIKRGFEQKDNLTSLLRSVAMDLSRIFGYVGPYPHG